MTRIESNIFRILFREQKTPYYIHYCFNIVYLQLLYNVLINILYYCRRIKKERHSRIHLMTSGYRDNVNAIIVIIINEFA